MSIASAHSLLPSTLGNVMKKLISISLFLIILVGGFAAFWIISDDGPSRWNACKAAEDFLEEEYGSHSGSWFITEKEHQINESNPLQGVYILGYTWNKRKGYVLAYYDDYEENPTFTIREQEPNKSE